MERKKASQDWMSISNSFQDAMNTVVLPEVTARLRSYSCQLANQAARIGYKPHKPQLLVLFTPAIVFSLDLEIQAQIDSRNFKLQRHSLLAVEKFPTYQLPQFQNVFFHHERLTPLQAARQPSDVG